MSDSAMNHHDALVSQLQGIYRANGKADPFLARAFNIMIFASYWASVATPDRPARHEETVK